MKFVGLLFLAITAGISCASDTPYACDDERPCYQGGIPGICLPSPSSAQSWCGFPDDACDSGYSYGILSGDGLARECVASLPVDAGSDGAADAADSPDAGGDDAGGPDSGPAQPPVANGQAAELVLGQSNFITSTANSGGLGASSLNLPEGILFDGTSLWIADEGNRRLLQWAVPPTVVKQAADRVLGKLSFADVADGPSTTRMGFGGAGGGEAAAAGARVVVTDRANHRVLIWNTPVTSGQPAALVLGQSNFTSRTTGDAANQMNEPSGLWTDGQRLVVADSGNHRVLIWNTFPTVDGQGADIVLGWSAFGIGNGDAPVSPPTAASLNRPGDVMVAGGKLFVSDGNNHRVLVWTSFPAVSGQAADFAIGQSSLTAGGSNGSQSQVSAAGIDTAGKIAIAFGSLFVCDVLN